MPLRHPSRRFASQSQALITSAVFAALAMPAAAQFQFVELGAPLPVLSDGTFAIALGDIDGDGDLDMVVANAPYGEQSRLYRNDGAGTYTDVTVAQMPYDDQIDRALALADVDGDGDLDLVIGEGGYSPRDRLYLNDGSGTFSDVTTTHLPMDNDPTTAVTLGDVDGDGDLDMIVGNYYQTLLYLNNGSGMFTDVSNPQLPGTLGSSTVVMGDVDGDGDLDLVIGEGGYNPRDRLYLNDGSGTFSDVTATHLPTDNEPTAAIAIGDVDGDGDLDMVVGKVYAQDRLYLNNGAGIFTEATTAQMPVDADWTSAVALGDIDNDGDLDIALGSFFNPERIYLNSGAGTFVDVSGARVPANNNWTNALVFADVDGDLDLDLVVANGSFNQTPQQPNRLYRNLQRQLHAPTAPQIGQPYSLDAYMRYGTSTVANFALPYLSTAPASIAVPPFGTLGIDLASAAPFAPLMVSQPIGTGSVGFTVPNVPSLVGQAIYAQAMLVAYPFDLRLSNVCADVIQ